MHTRWCEATTHITNSPGAPPLAGNWPRLPCPPRASTSVLRHLLPMVAGHAGVRCALLSWINAVGNGAGTNWAFSNHIAMHRWLPGSCMPPEFGTPHVHAHTPAIGPHRQSDCWVRTAFAGRRLSVCVLAALAQPCGPGMRTFSVQPSISLHPTLSRMPGPSDGTLVAVGCLRG